MKYVTFTHVDSITGVPVSEAPAANGPAYPKGARFGFALESRYPTSVPIFYGTILAADDETVPGILSVITKAEYDAAEAQELAAREALIPVEDPRAAWIPVDVMRERAEGLGIWAALAGYLAQNPELMLKVLTLTSGRINPQDEDLISGLNACEVPAQAQAILLAPMT